MQADEYVPNGHTHAVAFVEFAGDTSPIAHAIEEPDPGQYEFATQGVYRPAGEVYDPVRQTAHRLPEINPQPMLQTQDDNDTETAADDELPGQATGATAPP